MGASGTAAPPSPVSEALFAGGGGVSTTVGLASSPAGVGVAAGAQVKLPHS